MILELYRLDFEKKNASDFIKKYGSAIFVSLLILLNMLNLSMNTSDSMNLLVGAFGNNKTLEETKEKTEYYEKLYQNIKDYDDSLYRIEQKNNLFINDGMAFGFNGIAYSSSTYSKKVYDFLKKMGYSYQHVMVYPDGGNTKTMDMLFGVKYLLGGNGVTDNKGYEKIDLDENTNIYKNPYALSLAFGAGKTIENEIRDFEGNAFLAQNDMLNNISGLEEDVFIEHEGGILEETQDMSSDNGSYIPTRT